MFNFILIAIAFYVIRTTLEGFAGATGHMAPRYFAAKSDREAGLLSLLWICLLAFRWPFVAAVAVRGIHLSTQQGIADPEKVLPLVVRHLFPVGLKGLIVAGLMAAAMSTFDATVNSGAAYWARDIYQAFINPRRLKPDGSHIKQIKVVCNTHWDREFRRSFEKTRRRLLTMLDTTLDILEKNPRYHSFTMDSHCIMIDDYLEMRPERRSQVEKLIQAGRLIIGPWPTLLPKTPWPM